jgi:hypothetical protein
VSRRVSAAISVPIVLASFAIGTIAGFNNEDLNQPQVHQHTATAPPSVPSPPEADAASVPPKEIRQASVVPPDANPSREAVHTVPDPVFPVVIPSVALVLPLGPPPEFAQEAHYASAVALPPPYVARYYAPPRRKQKQGDNPETVPILGPFFSMFK